MKKNVITIDPAVQKTVNEILESMALPMSLVTRPQMIEEIRAYWDRHYKISTEIFEGCPVTYDELVDFAEKDVFAVSAATEMLYRFSLNTVPGMGQYVRSEDLAFKYPDEELPDIMDIRAIADRFAELGHAVSFAAAPNSLLDTVIAAFPGYTPDACLRLRMCNGCEMMAAHFWTMAGVSREEQQIISDKIRQQYVKMSA